MKKFIAMSRSPAGAGLFGAVVFSLSCCSAAFGDRSISLEWSPSPSTDVSGYRIYYGTTNAIITNSLDAGPEFSTMISGLQEGQTYFFFATAYDLEGNESIPSDPVWYTVPTSSLAVSSGKIALSRSKQSDAMIINFLASPGFTYQVQATQDFQSWVTVGTVTNAANGTVQVQDTGARFFSQRFYRIVASQ